MKHTVGIIVGAFLWLALASGADAAGTKKSPVATADSTAAARKAARPSKKEPVRTLDAIRIEGEIDVPQVLFITARDYRRFRDGLDSTYQPTSAGTARSIRMPSRLRMVAPPE